MPAPTCYTTGMNGKVLILAVLFLALLAVYLLVPDWTMPAVFALSLVSTWLHYFRHDTRPQFFRRDLLIYFTFVAVVLGAVWLAR